MHFRVCEYTNAALFPFYVPGMAVWPGLQVAMLCTRNFPTFVKTTAVAYGQKINQSLKILVACK